MTHPSEAQALYDQGAACMQRGDIKGAGDNFMEALARDPDFVLAHNGVGLVLAASGQVAEALECYDTAIRLDPSFASPYINRSVIQHRLGRVDEALAGLERALALQPGNPNANNNLGSILTEMRRPAEAIASFDRVLQYDPDYPLAAGLRILNKMQICDWNGLTRDRVRVVERLERGEPGAPPWALLPILDRPGLQKRVSEAWVAADCPEDTSLGPIAPYAGHERIKLGYYSADFHRHATAHLIAELFERHDRRKFEVFAFSFGPATGDEMQERLRKGAEHFIDVSAKTNQEIAALSRELEIDIAVDLKGITVGHRLGIFACRAAPIQVNYLGYPATAGAAYIDYIIGDGIVIPEGEEVHYAEEIVRLPHSYQVNDGLRKVADRAFTRAELGLPETGFVFCCFNNNFKIIPEVFDVWMNILHSVEGSVLWLIEDSPEAAENLRWEAERRGVEKKRLVFASRIAPEDHLARQRAADLFLDTYPYNAHTTASDALWVGLPLVTCMGECFASRVAGSLLTAMSVPELIVENLEDYEALAVALARDPQRLAALRQKIERNRATSPLFDAGMFARCIEAGYEHMIAARR